MLLLEYIRTKLFYNVTLDIFHNSLIYVNLKGIVLVGLFKQKDIYEMDSIKFMRTNYSILKFRNKKIVDLTDA